MENRSVSVVVPVFNEEKTIAQVVEPLLKTPLVSEVICVNDGSWDKTLTILKSFGNRIKLVDLKKNHGKGFALALGVKKAVSEIVVFLDGDLLGLRPGHVDKLVTPLLNGQARVTMGLVPFSSTLAKPVSSFTGQRGYWREDLVPYLKRISKTRYGVEVYLNSLFDKREVAKIDLPDLIYLAKRHKMPFSEVPAAYLIQILEISKTVAKVNGTKLKHISSYFDGYFKNHD